MPTNQLVEILNFNSRVLQKLYLSHLFKEINLLRRTMNLSCLYMNVNTSLDERKWCKTKWKSMWSSHFHGSFLSLVAQSALKYIFQGPQNHNFTLYDPPYVSSGGGNPLPYLPLLPHVSDLRSNLHVLLPT